jgi:hypothetical protein
MLFFVLVWCRWLNAIPSDGFMSVMFSMLGYLSCCCLIQLELFCFVWDVQDINFGFLLGVYWNRLFSFKHEGIHF